MGLTGIHATVGFYRCFSFSIEGKKYSFPCIVFKTWFLLKHLQPTSGGHPPLRRGPSCPVVTCRPVTPRGGKDQPAWEVHMAEKLLTKTAPPLLLARHWSGQHVPPQGLAKAAGRQREPPARPPPRGRGGERCPPRAWVLTLRPSLSRGDGRRACTPPAGTRDGVERKAGNDEAQQNRRKPWTSLASLWSAFLPLGLRGEQAPCQTRTLQDGLCFS